MKSLDEFLSLMQSEGIWEGTQHLSRNEHLVREGRIEQRLFRVKSGSIQVYMLDGIQEHSIRFGYPGSLMAALDSLITGNPTGLNVRALKKSELIWVSHSRFSQFTRSTPEHLRLWNEVLLSLILQQMEREEDLLTSSPSARYQRVLKRSPQVFQEIPHKYIASYLRMTPETLSRIKSLDLDQGE